MRYSCSTVGTRSGEGGSRAGSGAAAGRDVGARAMGDQYPTILGHTEQQGLAGDASVEPPIQDDGAVGCQVGDGLDDHGIARQQLDTRPGDRPADRDADADGPRVQLQAHGRIDGRRVRGPDAGDGIQELREDPRLVRRELAEVGLVVRVHPGHELDVRPVGIREVPVPRMPEVGVAPGPQLLAGRDGVVRHVHEPGVRGMVVAPEGVRLGADGHVRRRHRDVAVPAQVGIGFVPGAVVDPVVAAAGDGERRHRSPGVVGDMDDVRWEHGLVSVVDVHRDVRPPQEGLHEGGAVVEPDPNLDECRVWSQAQSVHALHPAHRLVLGAPRRGAAVGLSLDDPIDGLEGRRSMVLGPVELDTAGDPWSGETYQRGLDHILAIDEVVAGAPVLGDMDAATELRHEHQSDEAVLQVDGLPAASDALVGDTVRDGQRVHASRRALVYPALEEHRVRVRRERFVRRR